MAPAIGEYVPGPGEFVRYGTAPTPDGRMGIVAILCRWSPDRRVGSIALASQWSGLTFPNTPAGNRTANEACREWNGRLKRPAVIEAEPVSDVELLAGAYEALVQAVGEVLVEAEERTDLLQARINSMTAEIAGLRARPRSLDSGLGTEDSEGPVEAADVESERAGGLAERCAQQAQPEGFEPAGYVAAAEPSAACAAGPGGVERAAGSASAGDTKTKRKAVTV